MSKCCELAIQDARDEARALAADGGAVVLRGPAAAAALQVQEADGALAAETEESPGREAAAVQDEEYENCLLR